MKSLTAVVLSALLVLTSGHLLAAKKEGNAYGAGGVSEEKMSDTAAEHRKAYAGEKEKMEKEGKEEKEKKEKKMKKDK